MSKTDDYHNHATEKHEIEAFENYEVAEYYIYKNIIWY